MTKQKLEKEYEVWIYQHPSMDELPCDERKRIFLEQALLSARREVEELKGENAEKDKELSDVNLALSYANGMIENFDEKTAALERENAELKQLRTEWVKTRQEVSDELETRYRETIETLKSRIESARVEVTALRSRVAELEKAVGETSLAFDEDRGVWVCVYCAEEYYDVKYLKHKSDCIVLTCAKEGK